MGIFCKFLKNWQSKRCGLSTASLGTANTVFTFTMTTCVTHETTRGDKHITNDMIVLGNLILPCKIGGIQLTCTGVGVLYPTVDTCFTIHSLSPNVSNAICNLKVLEYRPRIEARIAETCQKGRIDHENSLTILMIQMTLG